MHHLRRGSLHGALHAPYGPSKMQAPIDSHPSGQMDLARPNIPDFDAPPVIEVAMALQFAALSDFHTIHAGMLWQQFKDQFPIVKEQPPLSPAFETFGAVASPAPSVEMLSSAPVPRYWFQESSGAELIQFQQDRFVHNWRKAQSAVAYPRYERIRCVFEQEVAKISAFLEANKIGVIEPNQCELTYVNHIELDEGDTVHPHLERWFTPWAGKFSDGFLTEPEDATVRLRFVLHDQKGGRYGRLNVSVTPAYRATDTRPIYVFQLTARGKPWGSGMDKVLATFDHQRQVIVRAFTSLTTPAMHKKWGRKDA